MAVELEALVGHIFIAGGRTIKTNPPGALCEVAPKKAARGREQDTFFVLVLPSGANAPVSFYEQMAVMAAERYFSTTGSVTSALRDVFNTLNANLYEHNASGRRYYEANIVAAVLRGEELFTARTGAAALAIKHGPMFTTLPETLSDEDALFQPPLGVHPIPEVDMRRFQVGPGARLLLVDAAIAEQRTENVKNALAAPDIQQAIEEYRLLVTGQTQAVMVEFVRAEEPAPVPVLAGESSKAIAAEITAQRAATASAAPAEVPIAAPTRRPNWMMRLAAAAARVMGMLLTRMAALLGRLLGRSAESRTVRYSTGVATLALFALPIAVVVLVVASWTVGVGETRFETCVREAVDAANVARTIDSSQPQAVMAAWEATFLKLDDCERLRPGDLLLQTIRREGRGVVDILRSIERRVPVQLLELPNANVTRLLLQGLTMYALDQQNGLVYRWQLTQDGLGAASTPSPLIAMRRGANVQGLVMGDILDIAYDATLDVVVAVGRNGVLFRCPPRFINECDAQQLLGVEKWGTPISIHIWRGNLYVLDTGSSQLWRYQPSGGTYGGVPSEYFTGSVRPDLRQAVDFTISTAGAAAGSVYVLYSNGLMTKHFQGRPDPFAFAGFPDGADISNVLTNALFLNDSPVDTAFYILSAPTGTIYETSLAGSFIALYRTDPEEALYRMSDIVTNPQQQIMYVASGTRVFAIRQRRD